ncbi:glycosyltransferase [Salmonella enterica]|uniref:glycosyltransferase n=1 Tax=Salmonella enterica TaxID=28901 RepID=UPI0009B05E62|nr:glycosyltransferase family 2 protein [Salmonella enterica]EAS0629946.1 glycosyltransferase family 2 protein [Salmonella enterica subsp. enterica serovar Amager]
MKTLFFLLMSLAVVVRAIIMLRHKPSQNFASIDAVVPAFNEGPCLENSLTCLLQNPYIHRVICVNDGSTDNTAEILESMKVKWPEKLIVCHQKNTGKGGALMAGVRLSTAAQVFLSDADTYVPPDSRGLGYMLAEIEKGADAVGGIPSTDLRGAGLLPHIRATVKMPMIIMKRTLQQIVGGAPFIISGACGLFRTEVLLDNPFSDRTRVEDLDLTWSLVSKGYRIRQCNQCIVYPQECNTLREEWKRWRRWIAGYAVCMCLHKRLLFSRFGFFSILPMLWVVLLGITTYSVSWGAAALTGNITELLYTVFPVIWVAVVSCIAIFSAVYHRAPLLILLAPFSVFYVLLAYTIWITHGITPFFTRREPSRDKPTRLVRMVEST